jgi:oligoribonuclease
MAVASRNLIWLDLEMTGLDVASKAIIEIAIIITDENLNELARWPQGGDGLAISHPAEVLERADPWVREHLARLLERCRSSTINLAQAEEQALAFISQYCPRHGSEQEGCPLAGNSVGHDRAFLRAHMPKLEKYTSYRNVDVSTIKELVKRWYPESQRFNKDEWLEKHFPGGKHNAMVDLLASIAELEFYRKTVFRSPE